MPRRYCRCCRNKTSHFESEICPACMKRAERVAKANARAYVADYFRDHPLFVPRAELRRLQDSIG